MRVVPRMLLMWVRNQLLLHTTKHCPCTRGQLANPGHCCCCGCCCSCCTRRADHHLAHAQAATQPPRGEAAFCLPTGAPAARGPPQPSHHAAHSPLPPDTRHTHIPAPLPCHPPCCSTPALCHHRHTQAGHRPTHITMTPAMALLLRHPSWQPAASQKPGPPAANRWRCRGAQALPRSQSHVTGVCGVWSHSKSVSRSRSPNPQAPGHAAATAAAAAAAGAAAAVAAAAGAAVCRTTHTWHARLLQRAGPYNNSRRPAHRGTVCTGGSWGNPHRGPAPSDAPGCSKCGQPAAPVNSPSSPQGRTCAVHPLCGRSSRLLGAPSRRPTRPRANVARQAAAAGVGPPNWRMHPHPPTCPAVLPGMSLSPHAAKQARLGPKEAPRQEAPPGRTPGCPAMGITRVGENPLL
jgi:hypothetical protein